MALWLLCPASYIHPFILYVIVVNQTKKGCDYVYLSLKQHDLFRALLMGFEVPFRSYIRSVYKELHADHETGAADNNKG